MLANFIGFTVGSASFGAAQRDQLRPYLKVMTSAAEARIKAATTGMTSTISAPWAEQRNG